MPIMASQTEEVAKSPDQSEVNLNSVLSAEESEKSLIREEPLKLVPYDYGFHVRILLSLLSI